jgi:hypothetical protein
MARMKYLKQLLTAALVVSALLVVVADGENIADIQDQPKLTPAKLTAADLEKLRWIEGTWRGTGDADKPFFERYRFENATTLASDSFDNEKLGKVTDTTRFELKDGEFGGGSEGSRWVATAIDENSISFAPVVKARNFFVWRRDSKDSWTAILSWPARGDKPAGEKTYKMERIK